MYVTGNNFRLTPEVASMRLSFSNLTLLGTGLTQIGISGTGNMLSFQFSGGRVISPSNQFVSTYNSGEPFSLEWTIYPTEYQFSFDGVVSRKRKPKNQFFAQRFFINSPADTPVSADIKLYSESVPYTLSFDTNYLALTRLTGSLVNQSASKFRIFNSDLTFYNTSADQLTGNFSGDATGSSTLKFSFPDASSSRFDAEVKFLAEFDTSIGTISGSFTSNRVSGLDTVVSSLDADTGNVSIPVLFDGSGVSGNVFTYYPTPASTLITYFSSSTNLRGEALNKIINIELDDVSPVDSGAYRRDYVTGFIVGTGGEYITPPSMKVTGYYFVSGLNWDLNSILLSSGCSGDLPVRFSGNNSRSNNGSGVLKTTRVMLSGVYGEGLNTYYLPQSYQLVSGGTGYVAIPNGYLQTGIFANCYDVGAKYNSTFSLYRPFSGSGVLGSQADFLTGEVLCQTGLVSGGALTGYKVTGVRITNPGSGYDANTFIPRMSFYRQSGDTLTANATGTFGMYQTGLYRLTGNWSLETGISSTDLTLMTSLSGTAYLTSGQNYLSVKVNYSGLDNTSPVICKVIVAMSGADTLTHLLSGIKRYDTSTGFLKKKNTLALITYSPANDLGFLVTQSELDTYYSSSEFMGNTAFDTGDLDF
jgi:hypothetical protein